MGFLVSPSFEYRWGRSRQNDNLDTLQVHVLLELGQEVVLVRALTYDPVKETAKICLFLESFRTFWNLLDSL